MVRLTKAERTRQTIRATLYSGSCTYEVFSLRDMIDQYGIDAKFEIEFEDLSYCDGQAAIMTIYEDRLETDSEYEGRLTGLRQLKEWNAQADRLKAEEAEAAERAEYERLRAKFG